MRNQLKAQWLTVPVYIRKPVIFVVGFIFILAAALTGWLPGPGGIPLFLIGVAVLSTEFKWAKRLRDLVMGVVNRSAEWYRHNRQLGLVILGVVAVIGAVSLGFMIRMVFFS